MRASGNGEGQREKERVLFARKPMEPVTNMVLFSRNWTMSNPICKRAWKVRDNLEVLLSEAKDSSWDASFILEIVVAIDLIIHLHKFIWYSLPIKFPKLFICKSMWYSLPLNYLSYSYVRKRSKYTVHYNKKTESFGWRHNFICLKYILITIRWCERDSSWGIFDWRSFLTICFDFR